ncbi:MFS transporter [Streptomyces sp. ISL-36]|uniref:MFS transporter n=1 Tax=Streptomyces sp. ISL-36 TaxID=2819182 RepID=UPI001BED00ED|nr:MFS transporter [Streptomyces sp. ISL-36]MBT2439265.1 MFS transporter [Streptomyces sp. ISL-36]
MTTTSTRPALSKDGGTDNRPGLLLGVVLAAQFMALLDVFIVNVAAPTIRTELSASGAGLQLVIAGYTIAYAVLLITGARLGDRIGHRRLYLGGLAVFTVASLACGLAAGTGQLITFRLVQGAGAALMIPQVLSLIQRNFTGEGRARALSAYSAVLATGAAAGQVVGGILVSADLFGTGWRPVFLVNMPIGLVLLALGAKVLPRDALTVPEPALTVPEPALTVPEPARLGPGSGRIGPGHGRTAAGRGRSLDLPGLVLLALAVSLLTVPLVLGQEQDWPRWSWISLAASAVVFVTFGAYESRLARHGGAPLIAPRVLRVPGIGRAALRIALAMAVNAGFLFGLTLHLQGGLGHSALRAGLTFAPAAVVFGVVGLTWRRLPVRVQRFLIPGGFLLAAAASVAMGGVLRDGGTGGWGLHLALACMGAGLSLAFSPALTGALATVRPEDAADASGLLATVTQLGQLIGVASFGTLFLGGLHAPGAHASGEALWRCALALAAASILGASTGLVRRAR